MRGTILIDREAKYTKRLLDSAFFKDIPNMQLAGVVAAQPNGLGLTRARNLNIPTFVVEQRLFPNAATYCTAVLHKLKDIDTDFVVVDSFAGELGCVRKHYGSRVFTVQLTAVEQTMEIAVLQGGEQVCFGAVELQAGDTKEEFTKKVYALAEELLVEAVKEYCK